MNKNSFILSIATGLLLANGVFAGDPKTEKDERILNSITYIDEDANFELGFDTADYLPEGFDPYEVYFDLNSVIFMEENVESSLKTKRHLPKGFDAYAYPTDINGFNYIDENDEIDLDFDTKKHLPEGFDAYKRNEK